MLAQPAAKKLIVVTDDESNKPKMRIKFDAEQPHQKRAWQAAIGLFAGQEIYSSVFSVPKLNEPSLYDVNSKNHRYDNAYGNKLKLSNEAMLENLRKVQLQNGLQQSDDLHNRDFTIKMETGTGKTYVYLRSIFEMNNLYGFTKFIIVVPSIAIKEGVMKSLEMTRIHFKEL